jgi:pyruvate kinase
MRHTKIVATLGPASDSATVLDDLVAAGVDVVRLNCSHGTHDSHRTVCGRVREASARAGRPIAVLQDLSGPKIRTGRLEGGGPISLRPGDRLVIATGDEVGRSGCVWTTFDGLARSVRPGDRLLLDDGRLEVRVEGTDGSRIATSVVFGGDLGEHKGINAPGVALPASALTPKDVDDLRFGLSLGVDMVALSFVQTADDLASARAVLREAGRLDVPLIAKLERPRAIQELDAVLAASDGAMVARGDLGLELPLERVPRIQKQVTARARALGLPVIIATQVLDSMRTEPRPTRAEVSDAAHAVDDGVDAIMLAGETAVGVAPGRVVRTLDAIIRDAEGAARPAPAPEPPDGGYASTRAICEAAVTLASRGHAAAIAAVTRTGRTACMLSALRPDAPVFALTGRADVARRLTLYWGVVPVEADIGDGLVPVVPLAEQLAAAGRLPTDATIVLVSVDPDLSSPDTNYLKLLRLAPR